MNQTAATSSAAPPFAARWRNLWLRPESATLLLIVISAVVANGLSPYFADLGFILESATYSVEFGLVALVLTLIIISGEIDLSAASMMALSACLFGIVFEASGSSWVAAGASLACGAAMGALNGLLITRLRLPSIIVTIGTLILYRGLAQGLVGDRSIGNFTQGFAGIDFRTLATVPVPVLIFIAAAIVCALVLGATLYGRRIYQIGVSEVAARHVGIRVERIKMTLFIACGLIGAVAGMMMASRLGSVRYDLAAGGELQMVLIVMLGGASIFGGRGTILGTFMAFWLLVIITTGMTVANIAINTQLTVLGLLLITSMIAMNALYARATR